MLGMPVSLCVGEWEGMHERARTVDPGARGLVYGLLIPCALPLRKAPSQSGRVKSDMVQQAQNFC